MLRGARVFPGTWDRYLGFPFGRSTKPGFLSHVSLHVWSPNQRATCSGLPVLSKQRCSTSKRETQNARPAFIPDPYSRSSVALGTKERARAVPVATGLATGPRQGAQSTPPSQDDRVIDFLQFPISGPPSEHFRHHARATLRRDKVLEY